MSALSKLRKAKKAADAFRKKIARNKAIKKNLFSNQTGSGRGKFESGNPPAPKMFEGMAKGTKGGDAKAEAAVDAGLMGKVTMTPDANFIAAMATRSTKKAAENRVALQKLAKEGNAKAKAIVAKIEKSEAAAVDKKGRATSQSLRDRKIYDKGTYINRETGEVIKDPKRATDFPDGGPKVYDFEPTAKRMEAIKNSIKAKEMTKREREMDALKKGEKGKQIKISKAPSKNTNIVGKGGGRFNQGGMPTKNRMGINDYRKGGYVLSSVDNRKNKGK